MCIRDRDNNLTITEFIADNPKRSFARMAMSHSSKYACEYCYSQGVLHPLSSDSARSHIVWPPSTNNGPERTRDSIIEICEKIDCGNSLSSTDLKGIKGRSPLLDYPNFDFVSSIPTEYMHSVCIGVVKKLLELTFNVGINRSRVTSRKLTEPQKFNDLMKKQKVPREFSRRARALNFAVLKAQEMRNICLFFFPSIISCLYACLLYTSPSPRD